MTFTLFLFLLFFFSALNLKHESAGRYKQNGTDYSSMYRSN